MRSTEDTVRALYRAFLAGDKEAMLAELTDDVEVRFLGTRSLHGTADVGEFLDLQDSALSEVQFEITALVVDGDRAAGIWQETATKADGTPWRNHGVDVFRIRDGRIAVLHENNDVRQFYPLIPERFRAERD